MKSTARVKRSIEKLVETKERGMAIRAKTIGITVRTVEPWISRLEISGF